MKIEARLSKAILILTSAMVISSISCGGNPFDSYERASNSQFLRDATRFAFKPSRCNQALLKQYPCEPVEGLYAPIDSVDGEGVNRSIHDALGSIVTYLASGGELVTKEYLPEDRYFIAEYLPKSTVARFQENFERAEIIGFGYFNLSEKIIDGKYVMALSEAEGAEARNEKYEQDPSVNYFSDAEFLRFDNPNDIPFSIGTTQLSAIYQYTKVHYRSFYMEEAINLERYEPTICRATYENGSLADIGVWMYPRCNRDFLYHAGSGFGEFVYPVHFSRFEGHPIILCVNDAWYGGSNEEVRTFGRIDNGVISYPLAIVSKEGGEGVGEDDWAALCGGIYGEEVRAITTSIRDFDDFFWGVSEEAKARLSVRIAEIPFSSLLETTESKRESTFHSINQIIIECY